MKKGKRETVEAIELRNQESIITLDENENYKYLGILEANTIKERKKDERENEENLWRTRKLETKLCSRNLIKGINTWAILLVRYLGPYVKWIREDLRQRDQMTKKLMTMHKVLNPWNDIGRLYVSRKEGEKILSNIEDWVDASIQRLEKYTKRIKERQITPTRDSNGNIKTNRKKKKKKRLQKAH